MKNVLSIAILITAFILSFNTNNAVAQEGQFTVGGGLVVSNGVDLGNNDLENNLGIRVEGLYAFDEDFRAGANFTFFFPKSQGQTDVNVFTLNFDGNYIFYSQDEFSAYGLGGINIAIVSIDQGGVSNSNSEFGLNLGAGLEYALDFADLFGELKFAGLGGDFDQLVIGAGLRFDI